MNVLLLYGFFQENQSAVTRSRVLSGIVLREDYRITTTNAERTKCCYEREFCHSTD